ncbi:MAG: hypothetical protein F4X56_07675 [Gammaproteobacteria bacterium]|nr:hypothetical protein [Gammaproteobacteria bacterium]MYC25780.1 hypothetical protein [Gammaproteobacteria bacterium]
MSGREINNSLRRAKLVPLLVGTGLSIVLCVGFVVFFRPFSNEDTQTTFGMYDRESRTPSVVPTLDRTASNNNNVELVQSSELTSIFEEPTSYRDGLVALDNMLQNANVSTIVELLEQSHNLKNTEKQRAAQVQIFRRFATLDPIRALMNAESFPTKLNEYFASVIYRDWSLIDLDSALAHAEQHVPTLSDEGKTAIFEQIVRANWDSTDDVKLLIAEQLTISSSTARDLLVSIEKDKPLDNPTAAWEEVLSSNNFGEDESNQLHQIAIAIIEKDGYEKFAELANAIQDRQIRTVLISDTLSSRVETEDFGTVFAQAVELFRETARPVVFDLVRRWSYRDPHTALSAVSEVPLFPLQERLEETVISTWIGNSPREVLRELESLPTEYREDALIEGIWSLTRQFPHETPEYLDEISDPDTRWPVMYIMLQNWASNNIEDAFTWFLDNPDLEIPKGYSRAEFLQYLLFRVTPETGPSLFKLALEYPVDESGSGWEGSIVGAIAREDISKAKELLPQVRDGPGRMTAYAGIGQALFNQSNNVDSVTEFTEEIPEDQHVEFYGEFAMRLRPQEAYEQLEKFPTPKAQGRVAFKLLQRIAESYNPFTDEQIEHIESFLTDTERTGLKLESRSTQQ